MLMQRHRFVAHLASRLGVIFCIPGSPDQQRFASLFAEPAMNEPDSRWFAPKRSGCRKIDAPFGGAAAVERRFLSVPE
jgi:hypothetical protein